MSDFERKLLASTAAGHQFMRDDRLEAADSSFAEALVCVDAIVAQSGVDRSLDRAELVAARAAAQFETGASAEGEDRLIAALESLDGGAGHQSARRRIVTAWLLFELARLLWKARRLPESRSRLEAARSQLEGCDASLLRARMETVFGVVLCLSGELQEALSHFDTAMEAFENPLNGGQMSERARLVMNIGNALTELGRYEEAREPMERALALYQGLVATGRSAHRFDLGRARRNLGALLTRAGQFDAAVDAYQAALADYDFALRRHRKNADTSMMRGSRASLLMNLGYVQFLRGDLDAADVTFRRAATGYAGLVQSNPQLQEDQARTWVNQAHLAAQRGETDRAARLYARGLTVFEAMMTRGQVHLEPDRINASLGLARMQLLQARDATCLTLFETAMTSLSELTRQGQLQHAKAWSAAWRAQVSAWLQRATTGSLDSETVVDTLQRVLAIPPRRGSSTGPEPIGELLEAVDAIAGWTEPAMSPKRLIDSVTHLVAHYLAHLFDWVAELPSESEPAWLRQNAGLIAKAVERLRAVAADQPDASRLLADWFFHTRGLRAQRSALAQGSEPQLVALGELLQELRRLEDEILGEGRTGSAGRAPDSRATSPAMLSSLGSPSSARESQRAGAWRDLRQRVDALREQLIERGELPDIQRLKAQPVVAQMARNAVLLLLARLDAEHLLVIALHRADEHQSIATHLIVKQHQDVAAFSCTALNQLARQALSESARGQAARGSVADSNQLPTDVSEPGIGRADQFALEMFQMMWEHTLVPLLRSLAHKGFNDVCLVPSDDLHLVPWNHLFDSTSALPCRLQIYPNSGAWSRCQYHDDREPDAAPRWAVAAGSALQSDRPLPWVEIEWRLSARMWNDAFQMIELPAGERPCAKGVNALLGMGHGGAPDGNPAHAGLSIEGALLSAHDLPRIMTCRRTLMSACVLGQTDEALGEPLGFLSTCFDYRILFGTGWLTEVPDSAACLFSVALQFALLEAYWHGRERPVLWSVVFRATRQCLLRGEWPPGFSAWLARELPEAAKDLEAHRRSSGAPLPAIVIDSELFGCAPEVLKRVLPWAVALGR